MPRLRQFAWFILLPVLACGEEPQTIDVENDERQDIAWEVFELAARRIDNERTYYIVEWDRVIESEDELWDYYLAHQPGGEELAVNRIFNSDDVWSWTQGLALSYCVSNTFAGNQNRAISEMTQATQAWEDLVNVRFVYTPSQNGNCVGSNNAVSFAVRPWNSGGACAFFPSGSGCVARTLVINFSDLDTNPFYQSNSPNMTTTGVFQHELGHILGFRHEHTRPNSGVCFEDNSWRSLTPYDSRSVMHYPWCNGVLSSDLSLTSDDNAGGISIYGLSAAATTASML